MSPVRRALLVHQIELYASRYGIGAWERRSTATPEPEIDAARELLERHIPDGTPAERDWVADYLKARPLLLLARVYTDEEVAARREELADAANLLAGDAFRAFQEGDHSHARELIDKAALTDPIRAERWALLRREYQGLPPRPADTTPDRNGDIVEREPVRTVQRDAERLNPESRGGTIAESPAAATSRTPAGPWTRRIKIEVAGGAAVVSGTGRGDPPVLRQALKDNGFRWRPQEGHVWKFVARRGGPSRDDAVQAIRDALAELDAQEAAAAAPVPSYRPTPQQQAIIDGCLEGRDVAVRALAGTGKTSTMRMVAAGMPDKTITYIAFNRSIADEAQAAFGRNVRADTMHAFARQALRTHPCYQDKLTKVAANDGFPTEIAAALGLDADDTVAYGGRASQRIETLSLVRLALGAVKRFRESADAQLGLRHVSDGAMPDEPELGAVVLDYARRIWADKTSPTGDLRFTHDDYLKIWALGNPTIPGDVIIFDEVQDVNELQARLVQAQSAQTIVVGDSYQSIYGFRGAKDFLRSWPAEVTLPLTQSWRFGPAVADTGNRFLRLLRSTLDLEGNPALDTRLEPVEVPGAVLCRTNAGAVAAVFAGMEEGKRVALVGGGSAIKDIARAAKDLQRGRSTRHPDLAAFASWDDVRDYVNQHDDAQSLRMFVQLIDRHGPNGLIEMANDLADENATDPQLAADLVVSTAHKAKGREWNVVRVADDFRGPTEDPETGETVLPPPEELRLAYVAVTRAQRSLDLGSLGWVLDCGGPATQSADTPDPQRAEHLVTAQQPSAELDTDTDTDTDTDSDRPVADVASGMRAAEDLGAATRVVVPAPDGLVAGDAKSSTHSTADPAPGSEPPSAAPVGVAGLPRIVLVDRRPMWVRGLNRDGTVDLYDVDRQTNAAVPREQIELNDVTRDDPIRARLTAAQYEVAVLRFEDVRSGDPVQDETFGAELDALARELVVFQPAAAIAELDNALDILRDNVEDRAGDRDQLRRWRQEERVTRGLREKVADLAAARTARATTHGHDQDPPSSQAAQAAIASSNGAGTTPAAERLAPAVTVVTAVPRFRPGGQHDLAPSGAVARVRANLAALQTLRTIQAELRPATVDEQRVLARWSGWGAVPQVFDTERAEFASDRAELARLLSPAERDAAQRNTLNAHYTDFGLAAPIWSALRELGFTGGRFLEPGCGSGNFIGSAPPGAQVVGVEVEPVTAGIAAALYPDAEIRAESFAATRAPEGSFDLTVGNVPFARAALTDRQHNAARHSIHNHFIIKSLHLTAPGGMVAVITSRYTLDAQNPAARREMAQLADLVGAIRLPRAAHQQAAGTQVVTDLLVFRRREHDFEPQPQEWVLTEAIDLDGQQARVNSYFLRHPEMVCGQLAIGRSQFSDADLTVEAPRPAPELLEERLRLLVDHARAAELTHFPTRERPAPRRVALVGAPAAAQNGHLLVDGDGFAQVHDGAAEPYPVPKVQQAELRALLGLRDSVVELLEAEAASADTTPPMEQLRDQLGTRYDRYLAQFGPLNRFSWRRTGRVNDVGEPIRARVPPKQGGFRTDPASALVYALESFDAATGRATKADIFTQRVVAPRAPRLGADTPADALAICMDTRGRADLDEIARLLGLTSDEAREALGQLVFEDPNRDGQLVPAAEYLSGNVRDKLAAAQTAAAADPRYGPNAAALTEVIPPDIAPEDIVARLGAPWIDERYVQQFLRELLEDDHLVVEHAYGSNWTVKGSEHGVTATSTWGTPELPGPRLAETLLEQRAVTVYDVVEVPAPGGGTSTRRVLNIAKTTAAQAKADELAARFADWVWEDPQRATALARTYNDRFNSLVLRSYDDVELSLPGLAMTFTPNPHQVAAVARMRSEPAVGLFHEVGAGKTAEMAMGVMELRRLGMVRKPAIVVPNHMLEQFTREFQQLYPRAKLLAASSTDLTKDKRRAFVARIATGDWDAIITTRGAFERIPMSPDAQAAYLRDQLAELRAAIERKRSTGAPRSSTLKRMENALLNAEERLKEKIDRDHDPAVTFEHSGIDYVVVDEAHDFKNLRTASNIPGAAIEGSGRASDLDMKLHYLRSRHGQRVVTLATATPIANSITETHVMQRYLRPDLLEAAGVRDFDIWAATFGQTATEVELSPDGASFRLKSRFAKFHNVPELLRNWWISGDVKTAEDLNLPRPELIARPEDGKRLPQTVLVPPTAELEDFIQELGKRAERVTSGAVDKRSDNVLKISGDGRAAALDMRLVGRSMPHGESKVEVAADRIAEIWARHRNDRFVDRAGAPHPVPGALQIVFCDLSTPNNDRWNVYDELRDQLVARGLPREQVRFIHEARNDKEKGELFEACRSGQVSVLIGSTGKMGVGTNVQDRAVALHHLDCPWRPADLAQREGRALRRGNHYPAIGIYRYVTEGSFDAYSWQTVARKAAFIAQVMRGSLDVRQIEDIGDSALSYNEVKALAAGNPLLLDKAKADAELTRLDRLERSHVQSRTRLRYSIEQNERVIETTEREITSIEAAIAQRRDTRGDRFRMVVDGRSYAARTDAGDALRDRLSRALDTMGPSERSIPRVAELGGLSFDAKFWKTKMRVGYELTIGGIPYGTVGGSLKSLLDSQPTSLPIRLENRLAALDRNLTDARSAIERSRAEIARATAQIDQPFPHREALEEARQQVLDLERQLSELAAPAPENPSPTTEPSHQGTASPTADVPAAVTASDSAASAEQRPPNQRAGASAPRPHHAALTAATTFQQSNATSSHHLPGNGAAAQHQPPVPWHRPSDPSTARRPSAR